MKRQIEVERRWRMLLVAACMRLAVATRNAVRGRKSSCERFTGVHRDLDNAELQSSEWIARLNADGVSDDDLARFEAWRNSHPDHARAYEELHSTWMRFMAIKDETDDCQFTANQATVPSGLTRTA